MQAQLRGNFGVVFSQRISHAWPVLETWAQLAATLIVRFR
jgi:hypothetical protein